jgi:hypothetical protein
MSIPLDFSSFLRTFGKRGQWKSEVELEGQARAQGAGPARAAQLGQGAIRSMHVLSTLCLHRPLKSTMNNVSHYLSPQSRLDNTFHDELLSSHFEGELRAGRGTMFTSLNRARDSLEL